MTGTRELVHTGRVWKFGDQINTDLILPASTFRLPQSEHHKHCFEAIRPGWADAVRPGDVIVGGTPEEHDAFIKSEVARWRKVTKEAGITRE